MLRCSATKSKEALFFNILNDTRHLIPYDRAYLFEFTKNSQSKIAGISGEEKINKESPLVIKLNAIVKAIKTPESFQQLTEEAFTEEGQKYWSQWSNENNGSVFWVPIVIDNKVAFGLWLEQWNHESFSLPHEDLIILLVNYLIPAFTIRWKELNERKKLASWLGITKKKFVIAAICIAIVLLAIPVPLRVVAPCEVVPSEPFTIRAPLEGVIKEVVVTPGDTVTPHQPLFFYEDESFKQASRAEYNDFKAKQLEENTVVVRGLTTKEGLEKLPLVQIQKMKEGLEAKFSKYQLSKLKVSAPTSGIVIMDSPDNWRGRPVKIGEQILVLSDPKKTEVKIWIPESDIIPVDRGKEISIVLKSDPSQSYKAKILYIANEPEISKRNIISYQAKAEWVNAPPKDVSIGATGNAILYGDQVSLMYFLFRKPWYTIRNLFGI